MPEQKKRQVDGTVVEALPNAMFRVELDTGHAVLAHVPGQLQVKSPRILPGDRVRLELSPFDEGRGRITRRYR